MDRMKCQNLAIWEEVKIVLKQGERQKNQTHNYDFSLNFICILKCYRVSGTHRPEQFHSYWFLETKKVWKCVVLEDVW